MRVKLVFQNMMYGYVEGQPEYEEKQIEVNDETTIGELFAIGDLSDYYPLSGAYSFNSTFLPYIINFRDEVIWDVLYCDARVVDFIRTHGIKDGTIHVKCGYVQAGGGRL